MKSIISELEIALNQTPVSGEWQGLRDLAPIFGGKARFAVVSHNPKNLLDKAMKS
jgi:hypothetical protein